MFFAAVRLLIVDCDPLQQFAIEQLAQSIDYETDCVPSGEDALRYFSFAEYAGVLVDLLLPGMDGFECLTHLRRIEQNSGYTPVIATSEHLYPDIRRQCLC